MLAVCLIQGSVSPHFFSRRLYQQVAGIAADQASIEDVGDHNLRSKIYKIARAETLEAAREAVEEATEELTLMGAMKYINSLEQRAELVQIVLQYYCEGRLHAALQQFKEGLLTFGVLEEVTLHPQSFECVFLQDTTSLTAKEVVDLFETRGLSTPGSNRRRLEVRAIAFWRDWLVDVEGGQAQVTLKDIVIFATGLSKVPAMGFPVKPQLAFLDPEQGSLPRANTCAFILKIPLGLDYGRFTEKMELGVGGSIQFGEA